MSRRAPPPRPRGLPAPHYLLPDETSVVVCQPPPPAPPEQPECDPGPDYTPGEQMMERLLDALDGQWFDYVETEDGELRQYWCPHCGEITAAVTFRCEQCGEWFNAGQIDDQVEKPDVSIPHEVAEFLAAAFNEILYGADARDALNLKPGKKRTTVRDHHLQLYAAMLVHRLQSESKLTKTAACEDVAGKLAERLPKGELDGRTVARWHDKFYPTDK